MIRRTVLLALFLLAARRADPGHRMQRTRDADQAASCAEGSQWSSEEGRLRAGRFELTGAALP